MIFLENLSFRKLICLKKSNYADNLSLKLYKYSDKRTTREKKTIM